jgi:hypothetical protein
MAVHNFQLHGVIDGRAAALNGGPRSKDGGISLTIYMRDEGGIETGVTVSGRATSDGRLVLDVAPGTAGTVTANEGGGFTVETTR